MNISKLERFLVSNWKKENKKNERISNVSASIFSFEEYNLGCTVHYSIAYDVVDSFLIEHKEENLLKKDILNDDFLSYERGSNSEHFY